MDEDHHDELSEHPYERTIIELDTAMPLPLSIQNEDNASFINSTEDDMMLWETDLNSENYNANSDDVHYLALDTNVLIKHLNLVRTVHALLADLPPPSPYSQGKGYGRAVMLIPSIIVRELDGLKNSDRKDPDGIPVGNLARIAITWLLECHRGQKTGAVKSRGAIRCQSIKERYDQSVRDQEADDQILDCCLYFAQVFSVDGNANNDSNGSGKVTLWSDDRNLRLKAECENLSTLGGELTLSSVFKGICAEFPPDLWDKVHKLSSHPPLHDTLDSAPSGSGFNDDAAMDLDMDYHHVYDDGPSVHQEEMSLALFLLPEESSQKLSTTKETRYPYLLPAAATSNPSPTPETLSLFMPSSPLSLSLSAGSTPIRTSPSPSPSPYSTRIGTTLSSHTSPESTSTGTGTNTSILRPNELITSICQTLKSPTAILLQHTHSSLNIELIDICKIPSTMIKQLTKIDSHLSQILGQTTSSNERQVVFRAISQTRTIDDWITCMQDPYIVKKGKLRKPRVGQVGDALDGLVDELAEMGVLVDALGGRETFMDLARKVRDLH